MSVKNIYTYLVGFVIGYINHSFLELAVYAFFYLLIVYVYGFFIIQIRDQCRLKTRQVWFYHVTYSTGKSLSYFNVQEIENHRVQSVFYVSFSQLSRRCKSNSYMYRIITFIFYNQ